ncbi:MAG: O-antigen ligase family protein [Bryobacterales bacterium]|nr:O-antigen ligase family protein [Bryobacterales bacterium]
MILGLGRRTVPLLLGAVAAVGLGAGVIWSPAAVVGATAALLVIPSCLARKDLAEKWTWWPLLVVLWGYAFGGRTFAGIGYGPVYVGELALGVTLCAAGATGTLRRPLGSFIGKLLLAFMIWCAVRTVPFLPAYGTAALRDAAIWGYGLFALVTAGAILHYGSLFSVVRLYGRAIWVFLLWLLLVGYVRVLTPSAAVGKVFWLGGLLKPGDVSVHLAGVASFLLLGLHRHGSANLRGGWIQEWLLWPIWLLSFLLSASQNRGGLLSVLVSLSVVLALWRRGGWGKLAVATLCLLMAFTFLELDVDVGAPRKASPQQIVVNLLSLSGGAGSVNEGTRQWRLGWWRKIWGYTVQGDYFWGGKGFGRNLADEDGFQTDSAHSLRSPHNGHLTILARSGVPGFTLWLLLQICLWLGLLRRYSGAARAKQTRRAALIVWLLAYLAAFSVNSAFDVYLEGPQGGIWFWVMFGVGVSIVAEAHWKRTQAPAPHCALLPQTAHLRAV